MQLCRKKLYALYITEITGLLLIMCSTHVISISKFENFRENKLLPPSFFATTVKLQIIMRCAESDESLSENECIPKIIRK